MDPALLTSILWCLGASALAALLFTIIGLVPGTSETATIAPATLVVILLGFPPAAVLSFCLAAVASKHLVHAVPTALLGVPGDNMAIPMLEPSAKMRALGLPHIALQKMVAGGVLALLLSVPISVGFAILIAPLADLLKAWIGPVFTVVALALAFTSPGRWASVALFLPYGLALQSFNRAADDATGHGLTISFMLGMALGPMFVDLMGALSPTARAAQTVSKPKEIWLAPEPKAGKLPAPWNVLNLRQMAYILGATVTSAITFTFTAIGMTFLIGNVVQSRVKGFYNKQTTTLAVMNATTEATYIAEILIPLVALGLPISPIAATVGFPLFSAPPVYSLEPMNNLHTLLGPGEIAGYGFLAVLIGSLVTYPLVMRYARSGSAWVMRNISQEAILSLFAGLAVVLSFYEGGAIAVAITLAVGVIAGTLNKAFGFNIAAQMMAFFAAPWVLLKLFGLE